MIKVFNKNLEFIEQITKEKYLSDEYLMQLYIDGFVDVYNESNLTVILYTHEEFKNYQKELKKEMTLKKKKEAKTPEAKKIYNEKQRQYYQENKDYINERLREYYRIYRLKKKLEKEKDTKNISDKSIVDKTNIINKQNVIDKKKDYYQENKDKIIQRSKKYYLDHKEEVNKKKKERLSKKKNLQEHL